MPWKARQSLLKLKTLMHNCWHCCASLPHVLPYLHNRGLSRKQRSLYLPRSESGTQANVLQAAMRQGHPPVRGNTEIWPKRSKQQDEQTRAISHCRQNALLVYGTARGANLS